MRKPKFFKKSLSFFLAFLMLMSSLTVGFTAFAANEYPNHKYIKDKQYSYGNSNAYDVTEDLEAVATGFIEGSAGNAASYKNVQSTASTESTALNNKLGGGAGFDKFRGTWITDDANGSMYKTVSALWDAIMVQSNVKSVYGSNNNKEGQLGPAVRNYFNNGGILETTITNAGKWNEYITSKSPYYSFALVGCGYEWPSKKGQSTNVVVDLNPEYYLWNEYGGGDGNLSKLDDLQNVLTTKYCYWWEMTSKANGTAGTLYCVTSIMVDSPCDFIYVNADELRAFRDLFAEGDTNHWEDFKNHNFDALSDDMKLTLVSQAATKYNDILTAEHQETKQWMRAQATDNNSEVGGEVTVKSTDADGKEGTRKLFEHYFGRTDAQFKQDLNAFYQYMVQKYLDAVDALKDALYNPDGSEKDITDLDELRDIKVLVDNAKTIRNGLSQEVIDANASTVGPNGTYTKNFAKYEQRFNNLWNTEIAKQYVEECKVLEPYAPYEPETVKIKRDSEAKKLKGDIDTADETFNSFLPEGVDYKTLATAPNAFTSDDISVADITAAKKTRDDALKTYDAYMYSRFLEIAREELGEYYTNEPTISSILVNNGVIKDKDGKTRTLTIFNIIPIRSQISKVETAYNALSSEYKNTANSKFFIEITTRLKAILDPITEQEKFSKDQSLYQLKYPMKDVQVDTTHDLDVTEVNALISNLDKFITSKAFSNALLNGLTADKFIDVLLQGYYVENGNKVWGTKTDENGNKVTMTEGLLTGESGDNLANMILKLLLPMVQNALKDVDLSKLDLSLPLNITLEGTAYDLQQGKAKAKLGIISAGIENHGYLLCADPDDIKDYNLIKANDGFASAAKLLATSGSVWNNVKWKNIKWGIESTDEFFEFIGALLSLIDRISAALFFDYTYSYRVTAAKVVDQTVNLNGTFKPGDGYRKAVYPFLTILGVTDTAAKKGIDIGIESLYNLSTSDGGVRWDEIVDRVGNAVLSWAKELVTTTPVAKIVEILPSLGYMLLYDKVTEGIDTIATCLTGLGIKWRDLLKGGEDFKVDASYVNNLLEGILGEDSEFKLPALDWAKLSYLGAYTYKPMVDYYWDSNSETHVTETKQQKYIDAFSGDVFLYFAYYIASIITENGDFLMNLAGEEVYDPVTDTVKPNIGRDVLEKVIETAGKTDQYGNAREFASAFYKFLRVFDAQKYDWTDKYSAWKQTLVDFNNISLFTEKEVNDLITYLSTIINNLIPTLLADKETKEPKSLDDFLAELLYKSSTVDSLFKTIYKAVGSDTVQMVLQFAEVTDRFGVNHPLDVSIGTLRENLGNMGFTTVANKLAAFETQYGSYTAKDDGGNDVSVFDEIHCGELKDKENESAGYYADDWGIETQEDFKNALVAILSPLDYIFGAILAGGTKGHISIASTITING
ncbi:MAG: hypothetical protein K2K01_00560, partial [Eubacterium sp.]|nr:hypothetical protein [Eubacterium sp.]